MASKLWNDRYLYIFVLPGIIWFLIFAYAPMYGIIIAFKDYDVLQGVLRSDWVGFKHFIDFFKNYSFSSIMTNTIGISLLKIVFGFPAPIIFALLLNEVRHNAFKRVIQTVSYMPYFVSWVIVAGIWYELLSIDQTGVINNLLLKLNLISEPIFFFGRDQYFWGIVILSDIWKNIGWNSIIYLAAITNINPELYEASYIDGANYLQRTWFITLPCIRGTISVLFIFAIGNIMNAGFDQIYVMQNPAVMDKAQIIDTYVMLKGIYGANYSVATAIGLFKSVIGVILLFMTNRIIKLLGEEGIV